MTNTMDTTKGLILKCPVPPQVHDDGTVCAGQVETHAAADEGGNLQPNRLASTSDAIICRTPRNPFEPLTMTLYLGLVWNSRTVSNFSLELRSPK